MSSLSAIKRPPAALIKLVEAIGILLRVPKSHVKSAYKAPIPSNYDATLRLLVDDFYGTMNLLTLLQSNGIPNDVAIELYCKTQEQYFDYEAALLVGGLAVRDLFNVVILILNQLQVDNYRIPVKSTNIFVIVDGTRSSYLALDAATHFLNHGVCHVAAVPSTQLSTDSITSTKHLINDLRRRCREQYKISENSFMVESMQPDNINDIVRLVEDALDQNNCRVLVVGIDSESSCGNVEYISEFISWAAWQCKQTVVLVKSFSRVRPFPQSLMARKFLVCITDIVDLEFALAGALEIMRPGDSVVLVSVVHCGAPLGDARATRFDMGKRFDWVDSTRSTEPGPHCPNQPGWNEGQVQALRSRMEEMLGQSQAIGSVRIERQRVAKTSGQELSRVALEEAADFIVLRRGDGAINRSEVSVELLAISRCTVVLTA